MCQDEEQQAARVEVQGPKRRVTRVESADTQDYVRERLAHEEINQEEADEMGFVPSALSELQGAFYWCDNRCSDEALRFLQIALMVIAEGGDARTINLCKAHRWQVVEDLRKRTLSARNVEVFHSQKGMGKKGISGCRSGKTRRYTRSVAKRISLQISFKASRKKCG